MQCRASTGDAGHSGTGNAECLYAFAQRRSVCRRAASVLQLDPAKGSTPTTAKAHPSVAVLLAWRYAQLLAALPKRDTETEAWRDLAEGIHSSLPEPQNMRSLEEAYGNLHSLQGKGLPGKGAICDVSTRRVLPYAQ